ncbi:MAG: ABC transporter permease subunit [Cohaesibacteraceae bacterium]|nr:ABC transporter permease subunit [Cohaesibacteraceae bacterium]MBL4877230.1 ABC transporter permease subunit [Cohaesibacteraceae bacterium]
MENALLLLSYGPEGWGDEIVAGIQITVSLALATLPFGLLLGFLLALAINSKEKSLQISAKIFTTIFRGLPELLTLFIVYFSAPGLIRSVVHLFSPETHVEISSFVAGMIALCLVFSSYASEVFLSAFKGIDQGQYEGANALGLSRFHTMRLVIFPQLFKLALPGLSNLWLILLKETSLVSVIGLADIMRQVGIAAKVAKEPFLFYGTACLIYLVLTIISSRGLGWLETWSRRGEIR